MYAKEREGERNGKCGWSYPLGESEGTRGKKDAEEGRAKKTAVEGERWREGREGGARGGRPKCTHAHAYRRTRICIYAIKCKRKEERKKGEEEATTKTPGEHPSPSGASSEKFLPFSPEDPRNPWEPHVRSADTKRDNARRFPSIFRFLFFHVNACPHCIYPPWKNIS